MLAAAAGTEALGAKQSDRERPATAPGARAAPAMDSFSNSDA